MARISELHYSNAFARSSGIAEYLEVALAPGEDPGDFVVAFYESTGAFGLAIPLDDPAVTSQTNPDNPETIYNVSSANFDFLLTDPNGGGAGNYEAYALVNATTGEVIDFYDIGGGTQNITAIGGPAAGATSENIPALVPPNQTTTTIQFNQPDPETPTYAPISVGTAGVICFARGTLIATPEGARPVEALRLGDPVATLDHGPRPLRWIGMRRVTAAELAATPKLRPIAIAPGALGDGLPARRLVVSPQHRMLVRSAIAARVTGAEEVLVPAVKLLPLPGVRRMAGCRRVDYFHIAFDAHEVVFAEGAPAESFLPGPHALATLTPEARAEFAAIFPELPAPRPARPIPEPRRMRELVARHRKNSQPISAKRG